MRIRARFLSERVKNLNQGYFFALTILVLLQFKLDGIFEPQLTELKQLGPCWPALRVKPGQILLAQDLDLGIYSGAV